MQHDPNNVDFKGTSWLTCSFFLCNSPFGGRIDFSPHFSASHEIRGPAFKRRTMYSLLYWMERILFVDSNYQTIITQYLDLTKE